MRFGWRKIKWEKSKPTKPGLYLGKRKDGSIEEFRLEKTGRRMTVNNLGDMTYLPNYLEWSNISEEE